MRYQIIDTKAEGKAVYTSQNDTDQWKVMQRCGRMNFVDGGKQWRTIRNGSAFVRRERIFTSRFDIRLVES